MFIFSKYEPFGDKSAEEPTFAPSFPNVWRNQTEIAFHSVRPGNVFFFSTKALFLLFQAVKR